MSKKTDISFALGLAVKTLGLDISQLNDEQVSELQFLASDALLEQPQTEQGKKLKFDITREKANKDSEYVKNFSFGKDLQENKVKPLSVTVAKLIADNMEAFIEGDHKENLELVDRVSNELIVSLKELNYPLDYIESIFKNLGTFGNQLKGNVEGQRDFRKDQVTALAIGVKHPIFGKLDSRIVSFQDLDNAIEKLRKDYNFTEDDYRS